MITDALLQFSNAQSLIGAAATTVSTNTLDTGAQARDIGSGEPLILRYNVDTTFTGGTSMQVQLISSASANLSSPTVLASGPVHAEAALVAGFAGSFAVPANLTPTVQRYLGVQYVTLGTHTTGAVTAQILLDQVAQRNYASGFVVN